MTKNILSSQQIADTLTQKFGDGISKLTIQEWSEGSKKTKTESIWVYLDRSLLKDAISHIVSIDFPHLSVISGVDCGDHIDLLYHMSLFFGIKNSEIKLALIVPVPKDDLTIPTISDIIPGAAYGEREKQEMLGIKVINIPDGRRLFLPDDFPEGVYPWRKDETGIRPDMIKELYKVGRPTDRPVPVVKPKEKKKPVQKETPAKETTSGGENVVPEPVAEKKPEVKNDE